MSIKKIISGLLVIVFIVTAFIGCYKKVDTQEKHEVPMGRYVEEDIEMPETVKNGEEIAYQMLKNPKGSIEIYCVAPTEDSSVIQYTLNSDHTWEKSEPVWINQGNADISYAVYAEDGSRYAYGGEYLENKVKVSIVKSVNDKTTEEITPEDFTEPVDYMYNPTGMEVLSENRIMLNFYDHCNIYKDGRLTYEFSSGSYKYGISKDKGQLLITNQKQDGVLIIDTVKGDTISVVPYPNDMSSCAFTSDEEGNWYIASSIGISRLVNGGNTWETIVDGTLASMSMPSYGIDAILTGGQEDFYVMYQYGEGQRDIKHYKYDKDVPSTPSQTLTVISLNENATIRQAINEYRKKNQEVKVDYRVMMNGEDGIPVEDNIKLINTELMAGKGADIIVFDGMPVDSYIEKGVLADINGIIKPMIENGELQDNVMDRYQKDGATYATSLRFLVPFVFGKQEAMNNTKSIQSLADYAENKAELSLFGEQVYTYSYLSSKLYQLYSNRFLGTDKKFNREELISFLEQLKIIYMQTKVTEETGEVANETDAILPAMLIYEKYAELGLINIASSLDTYAAISAVTQTEGKFASIRDQYIPRGILGVNNASVNKEIAGDFIKVLYSYEVQNNELGDGLPVNAKALDNFGMMPNDYYISGPEGFEATQPSEEIRKQIITLAKSLKTPIREDEVLNKMVLNELQPFFTGEAKAEEIADQIIDKVEVYLSE
jgi:hypothetical protein